MSCPSGSRSRTPIGPAQTGRRAALGRVGPPVRSRKIGSLPRGKPGLGGPVTGDPRYPVSAVGQIAGFRPPPTVDGVAACPGLAPNDPTDRLARQPVKF